MPSCTKNKKNKEKPHLLYILFFKGILHFVFIHFYFLLKAYTFGYSFWLYSFYLVHFSNVYLFFFACLFHISAMVSFCQLEADALPRSFWHLPLSSLWFVFSSFLMGWFGIGQQYRVCSHCLLVPFTDEQLENYSEVFSFILSPPLQNEALRLLTMSTALVVPGHPGMPVVWRVLPWILLSHDHIQELSSINFQMFALPPMSWGTHCPLSDPINSVLGWMLLRSVFEVCSDPERVLLSCLFCQFFLENKLLQGVACCFHLSNIHWSSESI